MLKAKDGSKLLSKVLHDLEDYLPELILVGGWVPYLYAKYLWKNIEHVPLKTMDIDFGVGRATIKYTETIAQRVRRKNYGEHHVKMGKVNPFVPIVKVDGQKADVEFITSKQNLDKARKSIIGAEIKLNEIKDFEILLENPMKIKLDKISLNVASAERFVFHKLLTFTEREGQFKRDKDLYYTFYVLYFHPHAKTIVKEIRNLIRNHPRGVKVKTNIEKYFEDENDKGPKIIEKLCSGTSMERLILDVKEEAFQIISGLIEFENL